MIAGNASVQIPALTVRRADTTVEVGSGQSFAIAGMLEEARTQTAGGLPGIGDVPVLGALFHSDKFQRDETELVIVITPYMVRPASDPQALRGPDGVSAAPANDLQRVLLFRQYAGPSAAPPKSIPGDVGFIIR
jgi:pilus assembly protein CpaC